MIYILVFFVMVVIAALAWKFDNVVSDIESLKKENEFQFRMINKLQNDRDDHFNRIIELQKKINKSKLIGR